MRCGFRASSLWVTGTILLFIWIYQLANVQMTDQKNKNKASMEAALGDKELQRAHVPHSCVLTSQRLLLSHHTSIRAEDCLPPPPSTTTLSTKVVLCGHYLPTLPTIPSTPHFGSLNQISVVLFFYAESPHGHSSRTFHPLPPPTPPPRLPAW